MFQQLVCFGFWTLALVGLFSVTGPVHAQHSRAGMRPGIQRMSNLGMQGAISPFMFTPSPILSPGFQLASPAMLTPTFLLPSGVPFRSGIQLSSGVPFTPGVQIPSFSPFTSGFGFGQMSNGIAIDPRLTPRGFKERIEDLLERQALLGFLDPRFNGMLFDPRMNALVIDPFFSFGF